MSSTGESALKLIRITSVRVSYPNPRYPSLSDMTLPLRLRLCFASSEMLLRQRRRLLHICLSISPVTELRESQRRLANKLETITPLVMSLSDLRRAPSIRHISATEKTSKGSAHAEKAVSKSNSCLSLSLSRACQE